MSFREPVLHQLLVRDLLLLHINSGVSVGLEKNCSASHLKKHKSASGDHNSRFAKRW